MITVTWFVIAENFKVGVIVTDMEPYDRVVGFFCWIEESVPNERYKGCTIINLLRDRSFIVSVSNDGKVFWFCSQKFSGLNPLQDIKIIIRRPGRCCKL